MKFLSCLREAPLPLNPVEFTTTDMQRWLRSIRCPPSPKARCIDGATLEDLRAGGNYDHFRLTLQDAGFSKVQCAAIYTHWEAVMVEFREMPPTGESCTLPIEALTFDKSMELCRDGFKCEHTTMLHGTTHMVHFRRGGHGSESGHEHGHGHESGHEWLTLRGFEDGNTMCNTENCERLNNAGFQFQSFSDDCQLLHFHRRHDGAVVYADKAFTDAAVVKTMATAIQAPTATAIQAHTADAEPHKPTSSSPTPDESEVASALRCGYADTAKAICERAYVRKSSILQRAAIDGRLQSASDYLGTLANGDRVQL